MRGEIGTLAPPAPAAPLDDRVAAAVEAFRRDGVAVIDDVVDPALLADCLAMIERDYPADRLAGRGGFALDDDARRFSMALIAAGSLGEPGVLLNPHVRAFADAVLGNDAVMDSYGLLLSLPGAPDQKVHFDALLFPETTLDRVLPTTTIAVAMPLVVMDEVSGTTAFWRGSQRNHAIAGDPDFAPRVAVGSVLLWDYRVMHRGLANRSDRPRPVLFSGLSRSWWYESKAAETEGYEKLAIARDAWDALRPRDRRFLRRAKVVG